MESPVVGKRKSLESNPQVDKRLKTPKITGVFDSKNMPDHIFSLGDSLFLTVNVFNNEVIVHIRKYHAYGRKHYPTREGVTLKAHWIQRLFGRRKGVPTTRLDFLKEDGLDIVTEDFKSFKFIRTRSGKDGVAYSSSIILSDTQWRAANENYDMISTAVVDGFYSTFDFASVYRSFLEDYEQSLLDSLDISMDSHVLDKLFVQSLKNCIVYNFELKEPFEKAEEKWGTSVEDFNNLVMHTPPNEIARCFHEHLQEELSISEPSDYLSAKMLNKINVRNAFVKLRHEFCPKRCFEYFDYQ